MKEKFFGIALATFLIVSMVVIGGIFWYYTIGRKPKLIISTAIVEKSRMPASHLIAPGEILLVAGNKVTLFDTAARKAKWSSELNATASHSAQKAVAATPPPTRAPFEPEEKHDPMRQLLQARADRETARLAKWAGELEARRGTLKSPLRIANFNEEEAKYKAALGQLNADKAVLRNASSATIAREELPLDDSPSFAFGLVENKIIAEGAIIWLVQNRSVRILDRANGRMTKEIPVAGNIRKTMRGAGCLYVLVGGGDEPGQLMRINGADGSVKALNMETTQGEPQLAANGTELLFLEARLIEKKMVERETVKGDSVSDWESADKNTTGGWSADAAVIARTAANDAEREMTGGKELIDESTYEVHLRRPFSSTSADAGAFKVQGKPEAFSTPSMDLLVAGNKLIAFDHANKKLWESTLPYPLAGKTFMDEADEGEMGTLSQPFLEDDKRLYVFDRGYLCALDRSTGAALWRLPSVGIYKAQLDGGSLYVSSANAKPETLHYSRQATEMTLPLILKIDPVKGRVLWQVEKYQDCFVSRGGVYATMEVRNANDLVESVFQRDKAILTRFKIYKLSARDGKPQWEWFQTRRPLRIDADKRKVSLLFNDELQVLSSIAL
jgi:outer membrane protein assembly factor BamB